MGKPGGHIFLKSAGEPEIFIPYDILNKVGIGGGFLVTPYRTNHGSPVKLIIESHVCINSANNTRGPLFDHLINSNKLNPPFFGPIRGSMWSMRANHSKNIWADIDYYSEESRLRIHNRDVCNGDTYFRVAISRQYKRPT